MSKDKKPLLYAAGIVTLGIMAYRSSLFGDFVLDDLTLVVLNSHIQGFSQAGRLFLENIGAGFSQEASSPRHSTARCRYSVTPQTTAFGA